MMIKCSWVSQQGRIQDFKLGGGAHLKKLRREEGGANIFGVLCWLNVRELVKECGMVFLIVTILRSHSIFLKTYYISASVVLLYCII
jgi:hypothetical protein